MREYSHADKAALASQEIATRFQGEEGTPIEIIIPHARADNPQVITYLKEISHITGVVKIYPAEASQGFLRIKAIQDMPSRSPAAEKLIHELRLVTPPTGTVIGGTAADFTDG